MRARHLDRMSWAFVGMVFAAGLARAVAAADPAEQARKVASLAGFRGGLVVQVGCADGRLTAALRLGENCVVQAVEPDAARVVAARQAIRAAGVYGPVSVVRWSGGKLPYVDNLATLVVCEDPQAVPEAELMRVVRPHGAVVVRREGRWTVRFKPKAPGTDEWHQHFHDADNNAVARDTVVGPPRRYQWLGEPEWQRSHLAMPSINSMVSAKGRLFTVEDLASAEHPALPGKYALVARDAFNGIVLWRVRFADWHPTYIRNKEMPVQIQRRLVALGEEVYCTPGYAAPITVYEAATGKVLRTLEATAGTMEFVCDRGVLFAVTGEQSDISPSLENPAQNALKSSMFRREAYGPLIRRSENPRNEVLAVDAADGRVLWKASGAVTKGYEGATLGVVGERVVFATRGELVCLDRATGRALWRAAAPVVLKGPAGIAASLVLSETAAYLADSQRLRAFALDDGRALWEAPVTINHHKPPDVFLAGGLVWTAAYSASIGRPDPALGLGRMGVNGYDPRTGKLVRKIDQAMAGPMGHDRCYRNRITTRYYINTATGGSDFLDLAGSTEFPNPWIRSTCGIGPLPCNGLYYVGPPSCACCNGVMLNGMNAMAPEPGLQRPDQPIPVEMPQRLEKGPAWGQPAGGKPAGAGDWPTYRHDNARSGSTDAPVAPQLAKAWEVKVGRRAGAPVIAAGMVFVADVDGHAVCALRASDGRELWRFVADGRVDSPPTYHDGLVLFGSRDGTVYCLRAADGVPAWRFAPLERRVICAYGQPESAWPVCGSVLVREGLVYFAAGRDSFTDGGIFLFALEARSGRVVHRRHMYGPFGENGFPIDNRQVVRSMSIEGFKSDIFLADGELLYLRHQGFRADLSPLRLQDVPRRHLITSHGFLEAIPQHRSFWTIDRMLRYDIPTGQGGVHGDILVMDGTKFYEVRGYTPGRTTWFDPRTSGYTLFAGTFDPQAKAVLGPAPAGRTPAAGRRKSAGGQAAGRAAGKPPARPNRQARQKQKKARSRRPLHVAPSTKLWSSSIPLTGKAMVLAGEVLFVAGTPVAFPKDDLAAAYEGRMGGVLWAADAKTGRKLARYALDAPPAWDGLAAANGRLFLTLADGRIVCMAPPKGR